MGTISTTWRGITSRAGTTSGTSLFGRRGSTTGLPGSPSARLGGFSWATAVCPPGAGAGAGARVRRLALWSARLLLLLPLMPRAFVDYLTAPMPFLVGLHSSLVPEMRALPTEDIFHLDLDGGECSHFPEDLDSMPTRTTQTLQSALKKALSGGGRHGAHEGSDGDPSGGSMNAFTAGPQLDAPVDDAGAARRLSQRRSRVERVAVDRRRRARRRATER